MESNSGPSQYLTLKQYISGAKKIIAKYGGKFKYGFLKNDDVLSYVVYRMVRADEKFVSGSRDGYRSMHAKFAIKKCIERLFQKKKEVKTVSLDLKSLRTKLVVEPKSLEDRILFNEIRKYIYESEVFTANERIVLVLKYIENWRFNDIVNHLNVTPQRVNQIKRAGIEKLMWRFYDRP